MNILAAAGFVPAARAPRAFIALAAGGKLTFFALLVGCWAVGTVPMRLPLAGTGDLVFGLLFVVWLLEVRGLASNDVNPAVAAGVPASRARG